MSWIDQKNKIELGQVQEHHDQSPKSQTNHLEQKHLLWAKQMQLWWFKKT